MEEAGNGAAALQAARRLDGSLSLVVTDLNMPIMGIGSSSPARSSVPIEQCRSSSSLRWESALIVDSGIRAEILVKPFTPDVFLDAVTRLARPIAGPGQLA